jgi:hypothetical protein
MPSHEPSRVYAVGRATGRYWEIGPQKTLDLPEPRWKEHNRLEILDEEGRLPNHV